MASLQVQTLVTGPLEENAYLLCREGMENAILIDPGDDYEALMAALRAYPWPFRPYAVRLPDSTGDRVPGAYPSIRCPFSI